MVGGAIIEVMFLPDRIWVNCVDPKRLDSRCAIFVERNSTSERIKPNDWIWWQGQFAMWTPKENHGKVCGHEHHYSCRRVGIDYDIEIKRIGFSGVSRETALSYQPETN